MTADQLRKSILQRAIQGKLVSQDTNNEPASVLLEKIREEKSRLIKEKKVKKNKNESIIFKSDDNRHYEKFDDGTVKCIEDEIPFEIPENWAWCRLETICYPLKYGTSSKSLKEGDVAVLRMGNIQQGIIDYTDLVFSNNKQDNEQYLLQKNDLLFNRTNSSELVGKTGIYKGEMPAIYAGYLIRIRSIFMDENYLNYVMNSDYQKNYCKIVKTNGVSQSNINAEKIGHFLIPIPPYTEQSCIVEKIKKLTPSILLYNKYEKESEILEQELPKQLKKSILQYAIQGKLVPQNPDYEPASKLLGSIREEKKRLVIEKKIKTDKYESFIYKGDDNKYYERIGDRVACVEEEIPFQIPENWEWTRLGNVSKTIHYGYTTSASKTGNCKLLRITDIQNNTVFWDTVPYCTVSDKELLVYGLNNRDILIARTGGTIGKSFIISNMEGNAVFASYLIRVVPVENINEFFIKLFLESPFYWQQLTALSMGTGQPNVNGQSLSSLLIPMPPKEEQIRIVDKLETTLK